MNKIKVLIVDDSAVIRKMLVSIFEQDNEIEVVGTAADPFIAREKIVKLKPDVLTLDVEMPRMDGITFLEKLVKHFPIPAIIISSITPRGSESAVRALELGAVDIISKPSLDVTKGMENLKKQIIEKVKIAARSKVKAAMKHVVHKAVPESYLKGSSGNAMMKTTDIILAVGSSTGGTCALREIIVDIPANSPGIVVVQHMPPVFTKAFAESLDKIAKVDVREAKDGDYVIPGRCLIAPGGFHMELRRSGARYYVKLLDGDKVYQQKPSVEVLFNSVAKNAGANAVGVMLTGMGRDGEYGMLNMKNAGAKTLAQDEKSCVVFGMPKAAIDAGGVDKVVPLDNIASQMMNSAKAVMNKGMVGEIKKVV